MFNDVLALILHEAYAVSACASSYYVQDYLVKMLHAVGHSEPVGLRPEKVLAAIRFVESTAWPTLIWRRIRYEYGMPSGAMSRIDLANLEAMLSGATRLAMQYSPRNAILYVSMVDAGTVELLREMGKDIVTSADLVSQFEAVLTDAQIRTHYVAQEKIDRILAAAWKEIGTRARASGTDEFTIVTWLSEAMHREGMVWEHGPNVSCGPNSADSHYEPTSANSCPIRPGDFVLIDIWGKLDQPSGIYYDITWTGVVDRDPTERERTIFNTVRDARDAAIARVQSAYAKQTPIAGWEPDDAARNVIRNAGFGEWFTHRTGHNIGSEIHGSGANLDNMETHDVRLILPNTCFSVEPGIYFPGEFGVRSEIDMITRPGKAEVTGRVQTELVRI